MNLSYWEKQSFFNNYDLAIIGSGIVGLNAAIHIKELAPQLKIIILERGSLPIGASTRNAGFACFGSMTELLDDLENQTEEEVFSLVEKRWKGLLRLRERIGDSYLKYKEWGGYELFRQDEKLIFEKCKSQIDFFNKNLKAIVGQEKIFQIKDEKIGDFGFSKINHLIHNTAEGQIHTGEMMKSLLQLAKEKEIQILNGIEIQNMEDDGKEVLLTTTNNWKLRFKKALICTNGFSKKLIGEKDVIPARNQVLITKPIQGLSIEGCFHYDRGYFYFRNIDGRILLGGGRNLAKEEETTDNFGLTDLIQNALIDLMKNVILPNQNFEIENTWSGVLGVGQSKEPIVESISENVFTAIRLGGMGIAIGSLVGEEGAKLVLENI